MESGHDRESPSSQGIKHTLGGPDYFLSRPTNFHRVCLTIGYRLQDRFFPSPLVSWTCRDRVTVKLQEWLSASLTVSPRVESASQQEGKGRFELEAGTGKKWKNFVGRDKSRVTIRPGRHRWPYSYLNASIGLIFAARRAGQ
jgi:hypothetical protein